MTNYKLHNDCKILAQRAYPENRHIGTNGWNYKGAYSNSKSGYYSEIYEKNGKIIIVFRGTEPNMLSKEFAKDSNDDVQMIVRKIPEQMKDAEKVYLETIKKYGKENVILTGHSLGGSLAQILGAKYGSETVTFSAYGTGSLRGIEINYTSNITNYGIPGDTIFHFNIWNQIGKTIFIQTKDKNFLVGTIKKQIPFYRHALENYGNLSDGEEYKKGIVPKFISKIKNKTQEFEKILKTKNRVLHQGEINLNDLKKGTPLFDLYIQNIISNKPMPTKAELDKRVRIGELIYVNDYVRSDGTKVSGYYRSYPRD